MILAIDGSTEWCCLALTRKGTVLAEKGWITHRGHTADLSQEIFHTLKQIGADLQQLEAVAVATGPGSFSGLRSALAVAKGIAFALSVPLVGVPTLDAMAAIMYPNDRPVWCMIRLGRGRAAAARYSVSGLPPRRLGSYMVVSAGKGKIDLQPGEHLLGDWDVLSEGLVPTESTLPAPWKPRHCAILAYLGEIKLRSHGPDDLDALEPIYLSGPTAPGSAEL